MPIRTYAVPGISCDHCKAAIEAEFAKLPAVDHLRVDVDAKTVVVDGDVSDAESRAAIDDAGYDVAGVS